MDRKILIVEDEPLIAKDLSFILEDLGIDTIEFAMSYEDAQQALEKREFDLILLDINLSSEKDGIDLAHEINESQKTPFIFITSYYNPTTVTRAKVTNPLAYLLKPFNQHDIRINVEMALYKSDQSKENSTIYIREKSGTIQLELTSVIFLEAQDNYTKIVCSDKALLISQTLKSMLEKLPESDFVRTHKSFAARIDHITMIKGGYVFLGDEKIPIGRTYKTEFQERIAIL
ncbi:LytR/AlgR family response regulator transcription factor [Ekhidna sp.]|uniref:LytR/AlgR family response regulator transcription factor n=1 Tax=Ekhidna sp. TaxID=2608089 RepID=UPI003BAA42C0